MLYSLCNNLLKLGQLILKFIWKTKQARILKNILQNC